MQDHSLLSISTYYFTWCLTINEISLFDKPLSNALVDSVVPRKYHYTNKQYTPSFLRQYQSKIYCFHKKVTPKGKLPIHVTYPNYLAYFKKMLILKILKFLRGVIFSFYKEQFLKTMVSMVSMVTLKTSLSKNISLRKC